VLIFVSRGSYLYETEKCFREFGSEGEINDDISIWSSEPRHIKSRG